jgi:ubiquinol-cytochrome c reductase cytochrome c1 subunit
MFPLAAFAAGDVKHPEQLDWTFEGPLGRVDMPSAQRGFQVYREVCAACHGIRRVAFHNLMDLGFSEGEVKTIASESTIIDGPNDDGEMFERPGRPSDHVPSPYANEKAARALHNGAYPPDLSLIIKARHDGANYLHSLLNGYEEAPEGVSVPEGAYYNPYFPGGIIKMAPPLITEGQVTYQDDTKATVDQMSLDVVNFLQWAAEPEMQERKGMGLKVMFFLLVMTGFFFFAKKRIWKDIEH